MDHARERGRHEGFDVLVYGATAGGVTAAVAAARYGSKVVLVDPTRHVGGMVTGGLGKTDMERQAPVIGGLAREFFERIGRTYGKSVAWRFEPSVAEATMEAMLDEAGVARILGRRLVTVERRGRIEAIHLDDGARLAARTFVDAAYEGDLMAAAEIPWEVGREGRQRYGESLAGRVELRPGPHQFRVPVSPFDGAGHLLPRLRRHADLVAPGEGDGLMQSYCYRLCLSSAEGRLPIEAPYGYDRRRYRLVQNHLAALGATATLRDFLGIGHLPGGKTDINSDGPVSTNLLGAAQAYPTGSSADRARIAEEHLTWARGLVHFLASDAAVPPAVKAEMAVYGLAPDEFLDTGGWSRQLYVREARRMVGEYVLTQRDLQIDRSKPDAIGLGGYNIDIREVQWVAVDVYRFPDVSVEAQTEGYLSVPVEPYAIPYGTLLPRPGQVSNLLVCSAVSASHVAFASLRMEPQFMIMGQAAGTAAALAARDDSRDVHAVDVPALQRALRKDRQILDPPPAA